MSNNLARAPQRATAALAPRADAIERKLAGFRPEVQPRVRALAARHPWIADLAVSFPALLFALAFPRRGVDSARAVARVIAGAPLAEAAAAAGVPMWLRAFPARAFARAIPALPDSPAFRRQIANHKPRAWSYAPRWLDIVSDAWVIADEEIALWFAREAPPKPKRRRYARRPPREPIRLVALWAWFSAHRETKAGALIATPWTPPIQWKAATDAAYAWRAAFDLALFVGESPVADMWLEPAQVDGFDFAPLRTAAEISAEAQAMQNCVAGYGASIASNEYKVWSIRRNGERVATLSLYQSHDKAPFPTIREVSGLANAQAPDEVWFAARSWLRTADTVRFAPERLAWRSAGFDEAAWAALWRPYWLAKLRLPSWLPLRASEAALYAL